MRAAAAADGRACAQAPGLNAADAKRGKALTNLLLADDGSFRGFGKDARDEYFMELAGARQAGSPTELSLTPCTDAADSRLLFFQGYKMQLDGLAELAGTGPLIVAHSGSGGQPLLRIVSVTLKHVADEATIAAGVQAKKVRHAPRFPARGLELLHLELTCPPGAVGADRARHMDRSGQAADARSCRGGRVRDAAQ
jgi:hypothetical protein